MRLRHALIFALLIPVAYPASAQWTFLSQGGAYATGDMAVRNGVLVSVCDNSTYCTDPLLVSTDGGATWRSESVADPVSHWGRNIVATPDGFVFHGGGDQEYAGGTDADSWQQVSGLGDNSTSYHYDPSTDLLYVTTQSASLGVSADRGLTWQDAGVVSKCDGELSFVHARGSTILTGYNQSCGGLHLSTDGGATWVDLGVAQPKGGFVAANGDLFITRNVNVSLVTPSTALFRSRDQGATWTQLYAAPGKGFQGRSTPLRVRTSIHADGTNLLFTANDRVYVSNDDGATWTDASDGITPDDVNASAALEFEIVDGQAYLLLYSNRSSGNSRSSGYGIYRRPVSELGFSASGTGIRQPNVPGSLTLHSAFPNPFADVTTISYSLSRPGTVAISVVDVLGRVIARSSHVAGMGSFQHTWEAGALPSGVYVVHLETEGEVRTVPVTRRR